MERSSTVIEKWNERYRQGHDDLQIPLSFFVDAASRLTPGRALDIACGLGRHSIWLVERGWNVTAIDGSDVAIASLREREPRVDARVSDIEAPDFQIPGAAYDLVVDTFFYHRPLFPQIWDALLPDGLAVAAFHLSGTFAIPADAINQLVADHEVLHYVKHTEVPTIELVLRKSPKS